MVIAPRTVNIETELSPWVKGNIKLNLSTVCHLQSASIFSFCLSGHAVCSFIQAIYLTLLLSFPLSVFLLAKFNYPSCLILLTSGAIFFNLQWPSSPPPICSITDDLSPSFRPASVYLLPSAKSCLTFSYILLTSMSNKLARC